MRMSNQEVIEILREKISPCVGGEWKKSVDMAISALQEQEETVSRKVYEQISWERDIAVMQLKDLGYSLGEKIRTDGNLISRADAIDAAMEYGKKIPTYAILVKNAIEQLPSAQPETCEGCKHLGKWENEVEYGYPSPCTRCKRRVEDHYER